MSAIERRTLLTAAWTTPAVAAVAPTASASATTQIFSTGEAECQLETITPAARFSTTGEVGFPAGTVFALDGGAESTQIELRANGEVYTVTGFGTVTLPSPVAAGDFVVVTFANVGGEVTSLGATFTLPEGYSLAPDSVDSVTVSPFACAV
ncbi:hypothetical protein [Pseudoclavibacter helvolus]|uniref:hypothetical protein n=1 Tax=Pseudoclavibacter helvolus TaxID=255205 RepID=UPI003C75ECC2